MNMGYCFQLGVSNQREYICQKFCDGWAYILLHASYAQT